MRSSWSFDVVDDDERYVQSFDRVQIDNPNPRDFRRLIYMDRLHSLQSVISQRLPPGSLVADIGCAQGNLALLLAEAGYTVEAHDLNANFLRYGQKKYERGAITWHAENIFQELPDRLYDAIVLGELVEHVAHPQALLSLAAERIRLGGLLVVTTPNGQFLRERLPDYDDAVKRWGMAEIERRQFGPGGEHHLFAYRSGTLRRHFSSNVQLEQRFIATGLYNSHMQRGLDSRLGPLLQRCVVGLSRLPILDRRVNTGLLVVALRVR